MTWVGILRNTCASALVDLGMAIAELGDRMYDCKPEDYFGRAHINHDCNYRKGDC